MQVYLAELLTKHWCVIEWWAILGKMDKAVAALNLIQKI
jgi:hypothetical protein